MRLVEVIGPLAPLAPRCDELAVLRELPDACDRGLCVRRVPLGDVDLAVRGDQHVVRLPEEPGIAGTGPAGSARFAQGHQHLAVGAELVNLVTGGRILRLGVSAERTRTVGYPDVPLAIHLDTVRRENQPGAERLLHGPGRIEQVDRRQRRAGTRILPASLGHPDSPAVGGDRHRAGRAPGTAVRELRPSFDGLVGIGQVVDRLHVGLRADRGAGNGETQDETDRGDGRRVDATC